MTRVVCRVWMVGIAVGACLLPARASAKWTQHVAGRVQIGVVHDSNVLEQLSDETSDQALQLFGAVDHQLVFSPKVSLRSVARAGLYRYRDVTDDSRILGEGGWTLSLRPSDKTVLGARLDIEGRDYADSASTRGYGLFQAGVFAQRAIGRTRVSVSGARTLLDYQVTPGTEQVGYRGDLSVSHPLSASLSVTGRIGAGTFDFNRRAVRVSDGVPMLRVFDQQDDFFAAHVEFEYLRRQFTSVTYDLLINDSNSFGAGYWYQRLSLVFRRRAFHPSVSVGLLARVELREYRDSLSDFDVINFDSEREDNNHVIGEVGKDLREDVSLKVRVGWHRNESVFRDRFQTKVVAAAHLEWVF